jgi:hypothetical protein
MVSWRHAGGNSGMVPRPGGAKRIVGSADLTARNVADSTLAKWATGAPVACLPRKRKVGIAAFYKTN